MSEETPAKNLETTDEDTLEAPPAALIEDQRIEDKLNADKRAEDAVEVEATAGVKAAAEVEAPVEVEAAVEVAADEPGDDEESPAPGPASGDAPAPSSLPAIELEAASEPEHAPIAPSEPPPEAAPAVARRGEIVLRLFGRTDVGQVRDHNEDNFLVADLTKANRGLMEGDRVQTVGDRGTLLAVCDGMGGAAAGEVASQLAVDIVFQRMTEAAPPSSHDELAGRLVSAIEIAGARIFAEAKADRSRRGMGTTSTVAALVDDHLFLGQVGDSRGYLLRGDRLVQVTRDQSLVNQLIEAGQLTEEEAETFEHNNIILQALGTADTVQVDLTYVELRRGDVLLLCSDGLSGMIRNDEIREVMQSFPEPLEACRELTDRANQAGGHDNVTVVVSRFDGEGLLPLAEGDVENLKYRKYELGERAAPNSQEAPVLSMRPTSGRPGRHSTGPSIELGYDDYESEFPGSGHQAHDPIELPREQAPSWIVTMMIVSAVTCVVVAGYYLLR